MKPFKEFFSDYCLSNKELEVEQTFIKFNLVDVMQKTYTYLQKNTYIPSSDIRIGNLASKLYTTVVHNISDVISCNEAEKIKAELISIDLSEKILFEFIKSNNCEPVSIISQIKKVVKPASKQYNYNQTPYDTLLKQKRQGLLISDKEKTTKNITSLNEKCRKIYWLGKGSLPKLVDISKRKCFIKDRRELFAFFQPDKTNVIVHWDAEKKYHLVYLLYRLFNESYAKIAGDKGYFCCAEALFCDMDGNPFTRNSLKRISTRIKKKKSSYSYIIKEIDDIINLITK